MTYSSAIMEAAKAFVKRRSSVQSRLAALGFSKDRRSGLSPLSPPNAPPKGVFGTDSVQGSDHDVMASLARWGCP